MIPSLDFNDRPFVLIWEITRACALACKHCRATAQARRHPLELDTNEGLRFIDQVVRARPEIFILTGGDPVMRRDVHQLMRYATEQGLRVSLSPSATPRLLNTDFGALKKDGVRRISLSLDGAHARSHDQFRGVNGTWNWTMRAIDKAREAGLEFQINTTITRGNIDQFTEFCELMEEFKPALWSVFMLVPTGRASMDDLPHPDDMEAFLLKLHRFSKTASFAIKTTEGPFYRRLLWQHREDGQSPFPKRGPVGINDGKGFAFVSHTGEINPSGFLPVNCGNVRTEELIDVYRNHPLFQDLRDPDSLKGKCGRCEFRSICGGSRARAWCMTGDALEEDPLCAYQPQHRAARPQALMAASLA